MYHLSLLAKCCHAQLWDAVNPKLWNILFIAHTLLEGSSMVKYTISLPCIGLIESDLELYIVFEFCEGKIINIWKTHWSTKPSNLC